uniref:Uncharacterized protein n=1 Tax=Cacopsylla melanoneura TaxID=428564 RepID=A0A8D8WP28_9HEMI
MMLYVLLENPLDPELILYPCGSPQLFIVIHTLAHSPSLYSIHTTCYKSLMNFHLPVPPHKVDAPVFNLDLNHELVPIIEIYCKPIVQGRCPSFSMLIETKV